MSTSHDINFTFKFAPGSPLSSDATSDQINQIVSGMHRLYDSIGTLYIPLLNAFADSYFSPLIAEVRNEIESNKKAIKELGKLPPKSRAKTAIAREKADAKRNQMTQRRNLLKTTKAELKEKLTNLQEQSKKGSTSAAILWRQLMDKMRSASYSTYGDNTIGSPHYLDVFDAFQQMMAEFSRDLFSSPDWTSELDAFKQLINDASDNKLMAAIVQISITARARLFPSDISWKQVSDNLCDDNGDVKVPQGQFELCNLVTPNTRKRQQKAIECAQISGIDKVGGASLLQISHVDDLLNDIIHGSVKNAFLSAPMGGVYNCKVNGVLYNSGSKTGGVMMPMIKHALRSGVKTTIIVHRVSLTRDLLARIREEVKAAMPGNEWRYIWHYNEQHYDSAQVLVTCMNSLERDDIKAFLADSACVIIDEFSQVQDNYNLIEAHQVNQRKTQEDCYRQAAAINETIMTAIASPEVTFVAMDADLETGLLTPIIELTNTASFTKVYKIQHPECQLPPKERTKQALFHRNKQSRHHFTAKITQHCQARQDAIAKRSNVGRFCIATDSRALTYTLEALCHSYDLKVCVINSDTSKAKKSDANKLLLRKLKPEDFDVVIMSPTITSGCSWITPSYKDCVVVACGVIPSYNLKQMAFRFRSITQIDVFAYPAQYDDIPPLDEFDIELANNIAHDYQYSSLLVMIRQHRTGLAKEATKNQRSYLYWQLEDEGWGCSTYDPTLYISDDNEEVPETNSSERTDRIMKAKKLSLSEYKAIHTNSRWHEDVLACVRFSASLNIAVSHNESDVRLALSPQHEISTRRIIKEVYASYKSELGLLLDEFMSDLFGSDWQSLMKNDSTLIVTAAEAEELILTMIGDEHNRNRLHRAGLFTTTKQWINKEEPPIKESAAVISCKCHRGDRISAWSAIESAIDLSKYRMFWLHDRSILLVSIRPEKKRLGLAILKNLLKRCGLRCDTCRDGLHIGGKPNGQVMRIAERRMLSQQLIRQAGATEGRINAVSIDCWPDSSKSGFSIYIPANGKDITVLGTDDIIQSMTKDTFLTESVGVSLTKQRPAKDLVQAPCACNDSGPIFISNKVRDKACTSALFVAEFYVDIQEIELTLDGVSITKSFSSAGAPSCIDLCSCFLPILATDSERIKAMMNGLTIHCEPTHTTDSDKELMPES